MKMDSVNKWLMLAANIGVIGGLVLVALELNQTTNAILGATYQAKATSSTDWNVGLAESNYGLLTLLKEAELGIDSLSPLEIMRVNLYLQSGFARMDSFFYQYELGLFDNEYYETVFKADMQNWVPRWRDAGMINDPDSYINRAMRPSFKIEIQKYIDSPRQE